MSISRKGGLRYLVNAVLVVAFVTSAGSATAATKQPRSAVPTALIQVRPTSGPGGTLVQIRGSGFRGGVCSITISFTASNGVYTSIKVIPGAKSFSTSASIPIGSAQGAGTVKALEYAFVLYSCRPISIESATTPFTVTP